MVNSIRSIVHVRDRCFMNILYIFLAPLFQVDLKAKDDKSLKSRVRF